jgi:hypothetical protein
MKICDQNNFSLIIYIILARVICVSVEHSIYIPVSLNSNMYFKRVKHQSVDDFFFIFILKWNCYLTIELKSDVVGVILLS